MLSGGGIQRRVLSCPRQKQLESKNNIFLELIKAVASFRNGTVSYCKRDGWFLFPLGGTNYFHFLGKGRNTKSRNTLSTVTQYALSRIGT